MNAWRKFLVPLILIWVAAAGLFLAHRDTMTRDEGIHIASAYLAIQRHDFRFDPEHPFFFKALTALPLLPLGLRNPPDDAALWKTAQPINFDSWRESFEWSEQWFYRSGNNADLMIFLSRIPGVLVMVTLCWLLYIVAKNWFSEKVALFSLFFLSFNPNFLAHGHLANTDTPIALAFLWAIYTLWLYFRTPTRKYALIVGLSLGVALITKFSAIGLLPIIVLWWIYLAIRTKRYRDLALDFGIVALIAWVVVWVGYGLEFPYTLRTAPLFDLANPFVDWHAIPLLQYVFPIDFVKGLRIVMIGTLSGREAFVFNQTYSHGVPQYFPLLYGIKTQLVGLLLMLAALIFGIARISRKAFTPTVTLITIAAGVFGYLAITSKLDIGIRHIMPMMVFFSLFMALSLDRILLEWNWKPLIPLIIFTYCSPVFLASTNLIGYSNAFVEPSSLAYRYFDDSNLDWGQDSRAIVATIRKNFPNQPIYSDYYLSPYALGYYGIQTVHFERSDPPRNQIIMLTASELKWKEWKPFQKLIPLATTTNSTFFYKLPLR
jgi:hypothetical protein